MSAEAKTANVETANVEAAELTTVKAELATVKADLATLVAAYKKFNSHRSSHVVEYPCSVFQGFPNDDVITTAVDYTYTLTRLGVFDAATVLFYETDGGFELYAPKLATLCTGVPVQDAASRCSTSTTTITTPSKSSYH